MHRFFVDEAGFQGGIARLEESDARHAQRVLRLNPGEEVVLMDGTRRFLGEITDMSDGVTCRMVRELPSSEAVLHITLFQGLPKAEKMELIVQKLTELGAAEVVPVVMQRCVMRLTGKDGEKKQERWQKIAREATKQSGRTVELKVDTPISMKQMLARLADFDAVLVPWEDAAGYGLRRFSMEQPEMRHIALVVGPEGGMSPEEVHAMEAVGARQVTLGPRILRTETAGIAATAALLALYGEME